MTTADAKATQEAKELLEYLKNTAGQQIITGGCVNDSKLQGRAATVKNKNQLTHE